MAESPNITTEPYRPRLVASTGDIYQTSITESHIREEVALNGIIGNGLNYRDTIGPKANRPNSNVFRSVEWTPDGSSLIAVTEDNCIRTFIAPPTLLTSPTPNQLTPYSISPLPSTPYTTSLYPFFHLQNPSTALLLTSLHSQPIHLRSLLYPHIAATYPLIHPTTEKYLVPNSLSWTTGGTHFLAGTDSEIHLFDISRYNSGPLATYPTGKKRKRFTPSIMHSNNTTSRTENVRSLISTLAVHNPTDVMAAGTYSRRIMLYSSPYQDGELISIINLNSLTHPSSPSTPGRETKALKEKGNGVTSLSFDRSGNFIIVVERKSNVVYVFDVRGSMDTPWAILSGRNAMTNQKLGVAYASSFGGEVGEGRVDVVVAGGTDGVVRVWEPWRGSTEEDGMVSPVESFGVAGDPVTSVSVHCSGSVLATSSGERKRLGGGIDDSGDDDEVIGDEVWDNGVSAWAV
ncbi:hypothetical protein TWF694_001391 [Orbilia ellipsospora]|uniref:WD40 repeat-like protein n=1 Tax=Orbilia ellipsospora TaxID=2528407 RepID=A0AAV9XRF5_9PEZI